MCLPNTSGSVCSKDLAFFKPFGFFFAVMIFLLAASAPGAEQGSSAKFGDPAPHSRHVIMVLTLWLSGLVCSRDLDFLKPFDFCFDAPVLLLGSNGPWGRWRISGCPLSTQKNAAGVCPFLRDLAITVKRMRNSEAHTAHSLRQGTPDQENDDVSRPMAHVGIGAAGNLEWWTGIRIGRTSGPVA
jgi:hypothetical protein